MTIRRILAVALVAPCLYVAVMGAAMVAGAHGAPDSVRPCARAR